MVRKLCLAAICSFALLNLSAQVTIGSGEVPVKVSLLDLRSQKPDGKNVTSESGGLVLPRVQLINRKTLDPFIDSNSDSEWKDAVLGKKLKDSHAGLMVYNLYASAEESTPPTNPDKIFHKGIYIWDGTQWQQMGNNKYQTKWFFPPAFNLPLPTIDKDTEPLRTFNLYDEYKRQFTKNLTNNPAFVDTQNRITSSIPSPIDGRLYLPEELDYVITSYDPNIIRNVTVSPSGILSYRVSDNDPGSLSFLNLVFVVKE